MMYLFIRQIPRVRCVFFFFFNDTATTEIYTLSLHDALPISLHDRRLESGGEFSIAHLRQRRRFAVQELLEQLARTRSEEHTSELQSPCNLVCRLLLEKKKHETLSGPSPSASTSVS